MQHKELIDTYLSMYPTISVTLLLQSTHSLSVGDDVLVQCNRKMTVCTQPVIKNQINLNKSIDFSKGCITKAHIFN